MSPARALLHGGRPTSRFLIRRRFAVTLHHGERVPARGGVIFAANHIGFGDGPILAIFSPRPVHALTKQEMFHGPLGGFLRACGQIPLDRFHADPGAVRTCLDVLAAGGAVGVFPEGRRGGGTLQRFHRGAAYLALRSGAPIVPTAILGTREPGGSSRDLPRRGAQVHLHYGEPLDVPAQPWPRRREQSDELSLLLRRRMLTNLAEAIEVSGVALPGPLPPGDLPDADPARGLVPLPESDRDLRPGAS